MSEHSKDELEELIDELFYSPAMRETDALAAEIKALMAEAAEARAAGDLVRSVRLTLRAVSKNGEFTSRLDEFEEPGGMTVEQAANLKVVFLDLLEATGLPKEEIIQRLREFLKQLPDSAPPPGWE